MRESSIRELNDSKNLLSWKFATAILAFLWVPLVTFDFDSHHDGLIMMNVKLLRDAISNSGEWPFNQYGSFWVFPQAFFSMLFPEGFLLLSIRIFTVICYWITGYLIWCLGSKFVSRKGAFLAVVLFFGSQPFIGRFASDLTPWPSAVLMPVIVGEAIILNFVIVETRCVNFREKLALFVAGLIAPIVVLTRAQVGIVLLLSLFFFIFLSKGLLGTFWGALGFLFSSTLFLLYLNSNGWLGQSLYDEFVFGSVYLKHPEVSHLPTPIFTSIGTIFVLILLSVGPRTILRLRQVLGIKVLISILGLFFLLITTGLLLVLRERTLNPLSSFTVFSRRLWMSIFLGAIVYEAIKQVRIIFLEKKESRKNIVQRKRNALLAISIAGQIQLWPFFDQQHFWWGAVPGVVIVTMVYIEKINFLNFPLLKNQRFQSVVLTFCVIASAIQWVPQVTAARSSYPLSFTSGIRINPDASTTDVAVQSFLKRNLLPDTRILNLCQNPDPFYTKNYLISASRIFVYWPQMQFADKYMESFRESKPEAIVTCSLNEFNPDIQKQAEVDQMILLAQVAPKKELIEKVILGGKTWQIWKVH